MVSAEFDRRYLTFEVPPHIAREQLAEFLADRAGKGPLVSEPSSTRPRTVRYMAVHGTASSDRSLPLLHGLTRTGAGTGNMRHAPCHLC